MLSQISSRVTFFVTQFDKGVGMVCQQQLWRECFTIRSGFATRLWETNTQIEGNSRNCHTDVTPHRNLLKTSNKNLFGSKAMVRRLWACALQAAEIDILCTQRRFVPDCGRSKNAAKGEIPGLAFE